MRSLYNIILLTVLDELFQEKTHVPDFSYFLLERPTGAITREEEELATTMTVKDSQLKLLIIDYHLLWAP